MPSQETAPGEKAALCNYMYHHSNDRSAQRTKESISFEQLYKWYIVLLFY